MMGKTSALRKICIFVFPIIFNIIFFSIIGTNHPASVWISYLFIHIAYFTLPLVPYFGQKSKFNPDLQQPLYLISAVYFCLELAVGILFIYLNQKSLNPAFMIQLIMAGIYTLILVTNLIANNNTNDSLAKHEPEVSYIKEISSRVYALIDQISDKEVNRAIERTYDLLHASPAKSDQALHALEQNILTLVQQLESAVHAQNKEQIIEITQQLKLKMEERNRTSLHNKP